VYNIWLESKKFSERTYQEHEFRTAQFVDRGSIASDPDDYIALNAILSQHARERQDEFRDATN